MKISAPVRLPVILLLCSSVSAANLNPLKAEHGVIDFSRTEIRPEHTYALDGKWRFYWHEFLSADGGGKSDYAGEVPVRGTWKGTNYAGQPLPADGWGTYELLILFGNNRGELALKVPNIGTAYRLYANGKLIAEQGTPGVNAATSIPRTIPQIVRLPQTHDGRILLVVHVSNFDDRHGGIWQTMRIGYWAPMQRTMQNENTLAAFFFGAILIIGLHHLLMYLRRREEVSNLAFAALCFLLAFRALVEGNRYLLILMPEFPWLWNSRIAYLSFYAAVPFSAWFLRSVFPRQFHRVALAISLALFVPACIAVLTLPPRWYTETLTSFQIASLVLILYSLTAVTRAVIARERGAKTLALGITGLFAAATVDILTVANVLNLPELTPFGIIGFILSQSVLLSMRQEDAFRRLEALAKENRDLIDSMETKIIERTATIAELSAEGDAVLDALSEGVFLINREKIVGNKFSRKILEILEMEADQFVGKPFSEIILRITGADLSEDARLYLNVVFNGNMDDIMVEQLNPLQKIRVRGAGTGQEKIIHFTFTRQRRREKIMAAFVSCRDITADEKLREEVEEREARANRQLEIVRTLFSVNPEALQAFYGSIESEIEEIDAALDPEARLTLRSRLEQIYRATHTIKGSAQLFKIGFIAAEAHRFEDKMQQLLQKEPLENLDMISVNMGYAELQKALGEFEDMIRRILEFQRHTSGMHINTIDVLRESLPKMVTEICQQSGQQARLQYESFNAEIIPRRFAPALRDSLVQCVRNALAHSIEQPAERMAAGKPAEATIIIRAEAQGNELSLTVRDDGHSFDLEAIRARAEKTGLKTAADLAKMPDHEVINLIFTPGFSTASEVGTISGRGAGMDIIARKIRQLGGKIRIQWRKGEFTEFTFVLPLA